MAVPKSKVSKQRRNKRRSSVWKLETPGINTCPKCGTVTTNRPARREPGGAVAVYCSSQLPGTMSKPLPLNWSVHVTWLGKHSVDRPSIKS